MEEIKTVIVDDNAEFRFQLRRLLQEQKGIEVIDEAREGTEAIHKIKTLNPDLVLLDIRMPWMNGFEVIEILKKGKFKAQIIVISSYEYSEYRQRAEELGASAYVVKKTIFETLVPAIRRIFAETGDLKPGITEAANPASKVKKNRTGTI